MAGKIKNIENKLTEQNQTIKSFSSLFSTLTEYFKTDQKIQEEILIYLKKSHEETLEQAEFEEERKAEQEREKTEEERKKAKQEEEDREKLYQAILKMGKKEQLIKISDSGDGFGLLSGGLGDILSSLVKLGLAVASIGYAVKLIKDIFTGKVDPTTPSVAATIALGSSFSTAGKGFKIGQGIKQDIKNVGKSLNEEKVAKQAAADAKDNMNAAKTAEDAQRAKVEEAKAAEEAAKKNLATEEEKQRKLQQNLDEQNKKIEENKNKENKGNRRQKNAAKNRTIIMESEAAKTSQLLNEQIEKTNAARKTLNSASNTVAETSKTLNTVSATTAATVTEAQAALAAAESAGSLKGKTGSTLRAGQSAVKAGVGILKSPIPGLQGQVGQTAFGGVIGGATEGLTEYAATGGDLSKTAMATGEGAVKGALTVTGFNIASSLAGTAGGAIGGTTGTAIGYSVPVLGWALLGLSLLKTVYGSSDIARAGAEGALLEEAIEKYQGKLDSLQGKAAIAEELKNKNPEEAQKIFNSINNEAKPLARELQQYHSIFSANEKLNNIVDMDNSFALWGKNEKYSLDEIRNLVKVLGYIDSEEGSTEEKINRVINDKNNAYSGIIQNLVENVGMADVVKLANEGKAVIEENNKNLDMDPFEYLELEGKRAVEIQQRKEQAEIDKVLPREGESVTAHALRTNRGSKLREGASMVHSSSADGMPAMIGEKGNPETVIPLHKFDQVVSDYMANPKVKLSLDAQNYQDIFNTMRQSYLEERYMSSGNSQPVVVNNNYSNQGGGGGQGQNMQYQTDLGRTFDSVFDMLLIKNSQRMMV